MKGKKMRKHKMGKEKEDKGKKEGGKEAQTISSNFIHKENPISRYLCTKKSYYIKMCRLGV